MVTRTCKLNLAPTVQCKCSTAELTHRTVATWQGLHRSDERIINFDPMFFELVIVDECHHAASPWCANNQHMGRSCNGRPCS